jgi:hypothetical protein
LGERVSNPMWIWICGPYAADGDADRRAFNLGALNDAALHVLAQGHVPLIGINMALPMMEAMHLDPEAHDIRRPLSVALMQRCDACLRIGGPSTGADNEVKWFKARERAVYRSLDAVPVAEAP